MLVQYLLKLSDKQLLLIVYAVSLCCEVMMFSYLSIVNIVLYIKIYLRKVVQTIFCKRTVAELVYINILSICG